MATISASIGKDHYRTSLSTPTGNELIADEPLDEGGADTGFSPPELLAASLGACTCVTLRMYADRKGWPLEQVEAHVIFTRNQDLNASHFVREITLTGKDLTTEQQARLLQIANGCYIHRVLSNPISIETRLAEHGAEG